MNSSTMWVGIIVVIVVIVAGAWYFRSVQPVTVEEVGEISESPLGSPSPKSSPATSLMAIPVTSTVTISMEETGFSPATVTVPSGTTVTFVNNGQAPHWPASVVHPTHEVLPEFDAKRGIQTGESYSFTFTKMGTWGFHDHLNPSVRGQVIIQ